MIPLRDEETKSYFQIFTFILIVLNLGVFAYQIMIGPYGFESYVRSYGLIPASLLSGRPLADSVSVVPPFANLLTAMFMHGGLAHIIGNMWFLFIFGDNVEEHIGHVRFLLFYLLTGIIASLSHVVASPNSALPLVGASGAIAGVLGAYIILFPTHRILTLIFIFIFVRTVYIPAFFFLGIWFLMQVMSAPVGGPVAWWAHIGGFVSGAVLIRFFAPRRV